MVKNFLKHTLSPSLSTPPSFYPTTAGTPPPTASEPSTPSTPALSTASTLTTNTLASPTIHLPSALAALVPPSLLHSPEPPPRLIVFDLDYTTEEAGVYPIVLSSYLMACPSYSDQAEGDLVKGYLGYVVSEEGQQTAADNAGSAPLPASIASEAQSIVEGITVG